MANTDRVLSALPLDGDTSFPVLVPNANGLSSAMQSGAREIAIFAAASNAFSQKNINCSIDESLTRFEEVTRTALDNSIKVRGYISCVMGCPYEGDVAIQGVTSVANKLMDMGCYEISLGDTIGTGTPGRTKQLIEALLSDIDSANLAVHFHDTYGQALANIYAALESGISIIDSSIAGLGGCPYARGASGNVATEDVVYMLNGLGIEHGTDLDRLVSVGRFICNKLERPVMSKVNLAMPES
jgi:hydroxymethylglutaryl-CoA lyase